MVTRRPLELTLVYSPEAAKDYGVFAHGSGGPIYDFGQIQQILTDENLAVPDSQWVSADPIGLTIYSRNVPDLTLVDLPGYIQLSNRNQPAVLRDQIADLCEQYIHGTNNIILAVCPADVDLANAEALKASRRVDPRGERTVGVITKLDLVDPGYAAQLLNNDDYPLKLGYIGVVCKPAASAKTRFLSLGAEQDPSRSRYEGLFFARHQAEFGPLSGRTGIGALRHVLTSTLENNVAASLGEVLHTVQEELSEVQYQLKVEFSDRVVTPEGYATSLLTSLKTGFERLSGDFTRAAVRHRVTDILQRQLVSVMEHYLAEPSGDAHALDDRFKMSVAALTRSGVGKKTCSALVESILRDLDRYLAEGALNHHPKVRAHLLNELDAQLKLRVRVAADMVENALKPLKHEIEFTPKDWDRARAEVAGLLQGEIRSTADRLGAIQKELGPKRLRKVVQYLASRSAEPSFEADPALLSDRTAEMLVKGKEAAELNHRQKLLKRLLERLEANKACQQMTPRAWLGLFGSGPSDEVLTSSPCLKHCPEIYLYLLNERITQTSALFVYHELIHEFLEPLPNTLTSALLDPHASESVSSSLVHGTLDRGVAMAYVRENPVVARHIMLLERRRALERVRDKLFYLKQRKEETERDM